MKKRKWKMPKWMEPYRACILNTGGDPSWRLKLDSKSREWTWLWYVRDEHYEGTGTFVDAVTALAKRSNQ